MSARAGLAACIGLVVLLAGCGGAPASTGSQASPRGSGSPATGSGQPPTAPAASGGTGAPASIDSCTVLSDADFAAATQENVTSRSASTLTKVFRSVCDIELDGGGSVTISILPSGGRVLYETSFEPYIGESDSPLDEAVPGLGDKAGKQGDDELMVLQGDVLFDVLYLESGRQDRATIVRYLAEVILAKLPCIASGCPGFTPPPTPSAPLAVDLCATLTTDEIQAQTGFAVLQAEPETLPGRDPECNWTLDTQPFPGTDYIDMTLMTTGGAAQFDFWATAYDPPLEHVPGLGDDALKTATIPGGTVYVLSGDQLLTVQFSLPLSVDDPYALVMPLVATAISRLAA